MAIALDTSADLDSSTSQTSPYSPGNYTCTGSNRLLLIGVLSQNRSSMAVTYNSVSMTELAVGADGTDFRLFGLINPASGLNAISVSWAGANSVIRVWVVSYTGVLQTGFPDATANNEDTASATSMTKSITTVLDNCWSTVFAWAQGGDAGSMTAGTGVTARKIGANSAVLLGDSNGVITPAGSFSQTVNWTTASTVNLMAQVSFGPAASATRTPLKSLLGVGL